MKDYPNKQYLDMRIFYNALENNNTEWVPTKTGITISLDLLSELKKGIDRAFAKAQLDDK